MLALALAAGTDALACHRSGSGNQTENQPSSGVQVRMTAQSPVSEMTASQPAQAKYEEAAFSLSVSAPSNFAKGANAELSVVLVAKPPFHVNQEYPHRFRVITTRGLSTPTKTIQRDSAKLTQSRLEMSIPVTLGPDAPYGLEGEMGFSVCTNEKCLMEKRPLALEFGQKS